MKQRPLVFGLTPIPSSTSCGKKTISGSVRGEVLVGMRTFCVEGEQAGDRTTAKQVLRLLLGGAKLEGDEVARSTWHW